MEKTMKTYLALGFVAFLLTPATAMAGNDATLSSATAAQQQAKPVKGNVVDENGEPLIGVSVKIVGAYGGAITDINGDFSVNGAEGKQLQFSYAGYKTQTITAGRGLIKVSMEPDVLGLDDVVVIVKKLECELPCFKLRRFDVEDAQGSREGQGEAQGRREEG